MPDKSSLKARTYTSGIVAMRWKARDILYFTLLKAWDSEVTRVLEPSA